MSGDRSRPVVVAVGNDSNGQALDWAAAEASARGCRLHVVHAERVRWAVDPSGLVPVADLASFRVAAEHILRQAVSRGRSVAPEIDVSAEAVFGSTVPLLVSQSRDAQLLVLGSGDVRFPRGRRRYVLASVRGAVARRATCPVAVVRPLRSGPYAGSPPRVVVGVDRPGGCAAALGFAFQAAAQRGVPVTAVHAWTPDVPADHEAVCGLAAAAEACAGLTLEQALEPWRSRFADVPVQTRLVLAAPAAALLHESEGAALIVVGSRAHGAARTMLFGSVSHSVVQRAPCPVVVVRTREAAGRKRVRSGRRTTVPLMERPGVTPVRRRGAPWG